MARERYLFTKDITEDNQVFTFANLGTADEGRVLPTFTVAPIIDIKSVQGDSIVNLHPTLVPTLTTFTIIIGSGGQVPSVADPITFSFEIIDLGSVAPAAETNVANMISQIRRLVNDPLVSGTAVRSDLEMAAYIEDSLGDIEIDYPDFTDFTMTSGTSISPTPDIVDKRLMVLKSVELVTYENMVEAAGDSILIQQGSIRLDTSKGTKTFQVVHERAARNYTNLINRLNMHGKSSVTTSIGSRVDNYVSRTTDSKAGDSLL